MQIDTVINAMMFLSGVIQAITANFPISDQPILRRSLNRIYRIFSQENIEEGLARIKKFVEG